MANRNFKGALLLLLVGIHAGAAGLDVERSLQVIRAEEQAAGIEPAGNFARSDTRRAAYYRCYYTRKFELPQSYDGLKLRKGSAEGCRVDETKYDVFLYAAEALSSGHVAVTRALAAATLERLATVVPHEDFHVQIRDLPHAVAEPAATLVGLVTGAAAVERLGSGLTGEAELFLRKASIVNRYYGELHALYAESRGQVALTGKQRVFASLERECRAIQPLPRSFNSCVPAFNNAGLAFDYTYTRYFPLVFDVYRSCGRDLRCTIQVIEKAPHRGEREAVEYLRKHAGAVTFAEE
ncbi:MAG TPA: hypothetical protein VGF16_06805 [Bryobacteraceae bacterium]|jgi:hypothetical protein